MKKRMRKKIITTDERKLFLLEFVDLLEVINDTIEIDSYGCRNVLSLLKNKKRTFDKYNKWNNDEFKLEDFFTGRYTQDYKVEELKKEFIDGNISKKLKDKGWECIVFSDITNEYTKFKVYFYNHSDVCINYYVNEYTQKRKEWKQDLDKYDAIAELALLLKKNDYLKRMFRDKDDNENSSRKSNDYTIQKIENEMNNKNQDLIEIKIVEDILIKISPNNALLIGLLE